MGQQELFDTWRSTKLLEFFGTKLSQSHLEALKAIPVKLLANMFTTLTTLCIAKLSETPAHHAAVLRFLQWRPVGDVEYMHLGLVANGDGSDSGHGKTIEHIQVHAVIAYVEHLFKGSIESFIKIVAAVAERLIV